MLLFSSLQNILQNFKIPEKIFKKIKNLSVKQILLTLGILYALGLIIPVLSLLALGSANYQLYKHSPLGVYSVVTVEYFLNAISTFLYLMLAQKLKGPINIIIYLLAFFTILMFPFLFLFVFLLYFAYDCWFFNDCFLSALH